MTQISCPGSQKETKVGVAIMTQYARRHEACGRLVGHPGPKKSDM